MTNIMNSLNKFKSGLLTVIGKFNEHHPYISFVLLFVGAPTAILSTVFVLTAVVMFPVGIICRWF